MCWYDQQAQLVRPSKLLPAMSGPDSCVHCHDITCCVQHLRWDTSDGHLHLLHSAAFPEPPSFYNSKQVTEGIERDVAAADEGESFKSVLTQKLFIVPQANVLSGAGQVRMTATGKEDVVAEKQAEATGAAKIVTRAAKNAALDKKKKTAKARSAAQARTLAPSQKLDASAYMAGALNPAPLMTGHPKPFGGEARPYMRPMPAPFGKDVRPIGTKSHTRTLRSQVAGGGAAAAHQSLATAGGQEYGQSGMTIAQLRAIHVPKTWRQNP